MGLADRLMERKWAYGFTTIGSKYVCGDCLNDHALKQYIEENATEFHCDYCGRTDDGFISMDVDDLLEFIIDSLKFEWGNPDDEGVWYDSSEGGYQGAEIYDGYDFVVDIVNAEAEIDHQGLLDDIRDALVDTMWCKRDPYMLPQDEEIYFTWKYFSEQVKHRTRYIFQSIHVNKWEIDSLHPSEILYFISDNIEEMGLITMIPEHRSFFRARISSKNEYFTQAKEIGTPSTVHALSSNRMSPAGIPMFYGAIDEETALVETGYKAGANVVASIGNFVNTSELTLLDLTSIPKVPSIFDSDERDKRWIIKFFRSFRSDFIKPIEKDGREHIEYVPTQIVTEYLRHVYKTTDNRKLDGIIYPSSKNGKNAYVLFFENEDCLDLDEASIDKDKNNNKLLLKNVNFRKSDSKK